MKHLTENKSLRIQDNTISKAKESYYKFILGSTFFVLVVVCENSHVTLASNRFQVRMPAGTSVFVYFKTALHSHNLDVPNKLEFKFSVSNYVEKQLKTKEIQEALN